MSIIMGNTAPNSIWDVAWQDGSAAASGTTLSLSDFAGKVTMLLLSYVNPS